MRLYPNNFSIIAKPNILIKYKGCIKEYITNTKLLYLRY